MCVGQYTPLRVYVGMVTTFYTLGRILSPFIFAGVALQMITCPPPFGKGGFGLCVYFHPVTLPGTGGAVTICRRLPCEIVSGHWRGSNDLLKATVRIATGGTPACENGCGHCPPGRSRFHFLTLLLYTILSKKASRKIPTL